MSIETQPHGPVTFTLGERLRQRREHLGLTQTEIAAQLGILPASIRDWETGMGTPSDTFLTVLATALDTSIQWLRSGIEKLPAPASELPAEPPVMGESAGHGYVWPHHCADCHRGIDEHGICGRTTTNKPLCHWCAQKAGIPHAAPEEQPVTRRRGRPPAAHPRPSHTITTIPASAPVAVDGGSPTPHAAVGDGTTSVPDAPSASAVPLADVAAIPDSPAVEAEPSAPAAPAAPAQPPGGLPSVEAITDKPWLASLIQYRETYLRKKAIEEEMDATLDRLKTEMEPFFTADTKALRFQDFSLARVTSTRQTYDMKKAVADKPYLERALAPYLKETISTSYRATIDKPKAATTTGEASQP